MRKNVYLTLALLFIVNLTQSQVALPYSTGFDNANEQSGWQEYRLGATSQFYYWNYTTANPHSAPNCLAHNYPVGHIIIRWAAPVLQMIGLYRPCSILKMAE